jgi:DNA mismatch repair protein MutH
MRGSYEKIERQLHKQVSAIMQTISDIHEKFIPLIGKEYTLPIAANKGLPGHFLEELLGIPHTPNALDCSDGELKVFPVKKLKKNGQLSPKESIAITMLNKEELKACDFNSSKCCKKMSRMLVVPYYRENDTIRFLTPVIIERSSPTFAQLYSTLESDYNTIRQTFIETGVLESKTGTLLQNRTKGAGHGTTSRAFYLRPEFAKQYIPLNL